MGILYAVNSYLYHGYRMDYINHSMSYRYAFTTLDYTDYYMYLMDRMHSIWCRLSNISNERSDIMNKRQKKS